MGVRVSMPIARRGPWAEGLTHKEKVMRLYRQSFKTLRDYDPDFHNWEAKCCIIEREFKKNKNVSLEQGQMLVELGKERLFENRHWQPMVMPYLPGGTYFQRYTPMPIEWCDHGALPPPKYRFAG
mmetsp:Transcript_21837/g.31668  ORF Transcript_21837/g.31668 Transcript_21837/m.31668 type:complete len:125 (+) Transcript_21837:207-581(+)